MDFLKYAFPVILNEVLWGLGTATNTAVLGHMGSAAVAANSVAQVARQLATVVAFGLSSATAIYLGKTIGEKKYEHAKAYAKRFVWLSVIMGVVGGVLILLISPVMAETMTLSETAKGYMRFMFFVMSYFVVGAGVQYNDGRGNLPIRRRYPVWFAAGYVYHVGMLDFIWCARSVCVPLQRSCGVYDPDE